MYKRCRNHLADFYHKRKKPPCRTLDWSVNGFWTYIGPAYICVVCVDCVDRTHTVARTFRGDGGDFIAGSLGDTFLGDMVLEPSLSGPDEAAVFSPARIRQKKQ